MQEFCAGVKILLERMDTHPEEFTPRDLEPLPVSPWGPLLRGVLERCSSGKSFKNPDVSFLTDEEILAIHSKFEHLRRAAFDKFVMRNLLVTRTHVMRVTEDNMLSITETPLT